MTGLSVLAALFVLRSTDGLLVADRTGVGDGCLTLAAAVERAVVTAPTLELARADVEAAEAEKIAARAGFLPQVSIRSRAGLGDGNLADNQRDNRAGVVVSQPLFAFGANRAGLRAARHREDSAQAALASAETSVSLDASLVFIDYMRAGERLAAVTAIEAQYAAEAAAVERRLGRQLVKRSDASGILAEYAFARARKAREGLSLAEREAQLETLLQLEIACGSPSSIAPFLGPRVPGDLAAALEGAVDGSAEIAAARAALEAAEDDVVRASRSRWPSLSLNGSYSYDYDDLTDEWREYDRVGLDLEAPLFQGGRARSARSAAKAERRRAAGRLAGVERRKNETVRRAWAQVTFLEEAAERQRDAMESFGAMAAAVEREYERGLATVPALIDAKRDYFAAVLSEIDTRYDLYAAQAALVFQD